MLENKINFNTKELENMSNNEFKEQYLLAIAETVSDILWKADKETVISAIEKEIELLNSHSSDELRAFYTVYYQRLSEITGYNFNRQFKAMIANCYRTDSLLKQLNEVYGTDIKEEEVPGLKEAYQKLASAIEAA